MAEDLMTRGVKDRHGALMAEMIVVGVIDCGRCDREDFLIIYHINYRDNSLHTDKLRVPR